MSETPTGQEAKAMEIMMNGIANRYQFSLDEMENVTGGYPRETYIVPKTHEEIDEKWDIVQSVLDTYGKDVAYIVAMELQIIAGSANLLDLYGTKTLRKRMHDSLDGKLTSMERFTQH